MTVASAVTHSSKTLMSEEVERDVPRLEYAVATGDWQVRLSPRLPWRPCRPQFQ